VEPLFSANTSILVESSNGNRESKERKKMKPGSVWFGIVLLAVGVCGLLDAAGVVDSAQTIGQWWPLAVIGWPLVEMGAARRVTLGGVVCALVGLTLLADQQQWVSDMLVWSGLAVFVGLAVLTAAGYRRRERPNGNGAGTPLNGAVS
jgi:sugar phosphate permease